MSGTAAGNRLTEKAALRGDDGRLVQTERIVDTIEQMFVRKQIDVRQYDAAVEYRRAFEAVYQGMRCALDQSNVGGGGQKSSPTR